MSESYEVHAEPTPYWRAVAIDFDGTLADEGQVNASALAAIGELRGRGVAVLLVTGRILSELRSVFPDVARHFDAIVGENGAILSVGNEDRRLAPLLDQRLVDGLRRDAVAHRCGEVLVAGAASDEAAYTHLIRAVGLDTQVIVNRGELMVLPAGVTKGTGVLAALDELGLSNHNTVAIGDAENDHALFEACELGVAVSNSVDALKNHADVVLSQPSGEGVAAFLRGPVMSGHQRLQPRRWRVSLGTDDVGRAVHVPASQLNLLVMGGSGSGKSFGAGLVIEQLVADGYSVLVVDPEGDHPGLGQLRDVVVLGGEATLPSLDVAVRFLRHQSGGVVLDLSALSERSQHEYLRALPAEVEALRHSTGLPHWLVFDEAQTALGHSGDLSSLFDLSARGYCLVTWQPQRLSPTVVDQVDSALVLCSSEVPDEVINVAQSVGGCARPAITELIAPGDRRAVLVQRGGGDPVAFTLGLRRTHHMRHLHKYAQGRLSPDRRFYFRAPAGLTGRTAANLAELEAELATCEPTVLWHHCHGHDFSRWIAQVFHDQALASRIAQLEDLAGLRAADAKIDDVRIDVIAVLQGRLEGLDMSGRPAGTTIQ